MSTAIKDQTNDTTNVYSSEAFCIMRERQFNEMCEWIGHVHLSKGPPIVFCAGVYVNGKLEYLELGRGPTVRTALEAGKQRLGW